jgi:hypothetical protein
MTGRPLLESARKAISDLMADESVPTTQTLEELEMLRGYIENAITAVELSDRQRQ